jgi:hypothetical protein
MKIPNSILVVVLVSILPALFTFVGWFAWIFGPRSLSWCAVVGFVGAAASFSFWKRVYAWPEAKQWAGFLSRTEIVLGLLCTVCLVIMFASCRMDGVADFPALEWRPVYELNSHGDKTEVTRLRYVLASASFATGWNGMALLVTAAALRKRLGLD